MNTNKTVNTTMMAALMLGVFTTGCAMQNPNVPTATKEVALQTNTAALGDVQGPALAQTTGAMVQSAGYGYGDKSNKSKKSMKSNKTNKSYKTKASKKSHKSHKSKKSHKSYRSGNSVSSYAQPYPKY